MSAKSRGHVTTNPMIFPPFFRIAFVKSLPSIFFYLQDRHVYVVVQFYPWFKFSFVLFLGMVMYDNEFKTKDKTI